MDAQVDLFDAPGDPPNLPSHGQQGLPGAPSPSGASGTTPRASWGGSEAPGGARRAKCPLCGETVLLATTKAGKELVLDDYTCVEGEWTVGDDGVLERIPGDGRLVHAGTCAGVTSSSCLDLEQPEPTKLTPAPCHELYEWLAVTVDPLTARAAQEYERIGCGAGAALQYAADDLRRKAGILPQHPPRLEIPVDVFGALRRYGALSEEQRAERGRAVWASLSKEEKLALDAMARAWLEDAGLDAARAGELRRVWLGMIWEAGQKEEKGKALGLDFTKGKKL